METLKHGNQEMPFLYSTPLMHELGQTCRNSRVVHYVINEIKIELTAGFAASFRTSGFVYRDSVLFGWPIGDGTMSWPRLRFRTMISSNGGFDLTEELNAVSAAVPAPITEPLPVTGVVARITEFPRTSRDSLVESKDFCLSTDGCRDPLRRLAARV